MERRFVPRAPDDAATLPGDQLLEPLIDVVRIMSRALAAGHYYETLRAASNEGLMHRGLTRSGVPRAVYRLLTGDARSADWDRR